MICERGGGGEGEREELTIRMTCNAHVIPVVALILSLSFYARSTLPKIVDWVCNVGSHHFPLNPPLVLSELCCGSDTGFNALSFFFHSSIFCIIEI